MAYRSSGLRPRFENHFNSTKGYAIISELNIWSFVLIVGKGEIMANSCAHNIQFGICEVHIDNGTRYRNGTVIIFRNIYNTLFLFRSILTG